MSAERILAALPEMAGALGETAVMLLITVPIAVLAAIPTGVLLWSSGPGGPSPSPRLHQVLNAVVNLVRSFPFLILLIAMIPITRLIVGTSVGTLAVTVPLCVNAVAYLSRFVEQNLLQVDPGVIEAAQAMGASKLRTIWSVLLVEARPGLAGSITIMVVSFISYSAIAGLVGGGGIGDFAIRHGYYRYETGVMVVAVLVMIALVQLVQLVGNLTVRRLDKRL
ncbi:D-methionine transport system permease protein [Saccharopolyspora antimicrobica]|uniref:D-methionine transport system permease protein n=1 Tax=Saccharopolyspora antimicrobica TaxID=455193 RepID=A0A1I4QY89_9PSEU|nr:methionine ABC transporter permease [Saccharopolyspora antimicrobica]RKT88247.1 D-methionine transport system permease protein [Saccharopolyspora antimicrobica]SFM44971.1 D-methionine transport system permease protein [Saccharopolyspora antimicrobica]